LIESYHKPVLLDEVLESLDLAPGRTYCDATLGDGGHSMALLEHLPGEGNVVGIDRDVQAIERAQQRLSFFRDRFRAINGNFSDIEQLLHDNGIAGVDGIVCDLGVSMLQISDPSRGFMYSADGPLSMRMQVEGGLTAADIVNDFSEKEIADIIYKYGEERQSRRIANAIVRERSKNRIESTGQLTAIIRSIVGERFVIKSLSRVFQSFRIYINDELGSLERFLSDVLNVLNVGGRLAVIEYHSLEARLVKNFIYRETNPCTCPKNFPLCVCEKEPRIKVVHKLIKPGENELKENTNSRSARLRVIEKI
jgi:16S rRNA (cytosine1402-N4)-methyltransferase